jgi:hypothetical protein
MSSRVGAWAIGVLWRAGTVAARVVREWLVLAARMIVTAYHGSRRAGTRAWHVTRHAAVATYRVLSRVVTRASVVLWHAATVTGRVSGRAARQMGRVCMRGALWANQAFWRAVLIAAGHAEQLAARQLNQKSE